MLSGAVQGAYEETDELKKLRERAEKVSQTCSDFGLGTTAADSAPRPQQAERLLAQAEQEQQELQDQANSATAEVDGLEEQLNEQEERAEQAEKAATNGHTDSMRRS